MLDLSQPKSFNIAYHALIGGIRLAMVLLLIWLALLIGFRSFAQPDPFVRSVEQLQGNPERGQALFSLNCSACHGALGSGNVGPTLQGIDQRRSDRFIIRRVTSGETLPMPQFQPTPQEMADLLSYLNSL